MLAPHIVSALLIEREADLARRAEQARLRRPDPWVDETTGPTPPTASGRERRPGWRRRHLRPA
jgi:hypothetical protein